MENKKKFFKEYKKILRKHGCLRAQRRLLRNKGIGLQEWFNYCLSGNLPSIAVAVARSGSSGQEERKFWAASYEWTEFLYFKEE